MRTPENYTQNLKDKIITKEMLIDALYSSNKRAKNYRDKEREILYIMRSNRYYYDKYDYLGKYKQKKEDYYKQKEIMLHILNPKCIHKELSHYEKERIYDYEDKYSSFCKKICI